MRTKRRLGLLLLLVVLLPCPTSGFPAEKPGSSGQKVLLSLRIAKARKEPGGIARYKSIARQQKNRRSTILRPPSSSR